LFAFSALVLAFQRFTCQDSLQVSGLTMHSFTLNQFPIKNTLAYLTWESSSWD